MTKKWQQQNFMVSPMPWIGHLVKRYSDFHGFSLCDCVGFFSSPWSDLLDRSAAPPVSIYSMTMLSSSTVLIDRLYTTVLGDLTPIWVVWLIGSVPVSQRKRAITTLIDSPIPPFGGAGLVPERLHCPMLLLCSRLFWELPHEYFQLS